MITFVAFLMTAGAEAELADLKKAEDAAWVADFEDGSLDDWEYGIDAAVEIEKTQGNSFLHARRAAEIALADRKLKEFSFQVEVTGGGGVRFGGKYSAFLADDSDGSLELFEESQERRIRLAVSKGGQKPRGRHCLKIVCAGSLVRVYVDGHKAIEKTDAAPAQGPLALVAGEKGTLFDNVRLSPTVSPEEGLVAILEDEDDALVYSPVTDAVLSFQTANHAGADLRLAVSVGPFRGEPVEGPEGEMAVGGDTIVEVGVRHFFRIKRIADQSLKSAETTLEAGSKGTTQFNLGKLPSGFHLLDISILWNETERHHGAYPFAVLEDVGGEDYKAPVIPVGVYTALMQYTRTTEPLWWKTYVHAIAHDVRKRHFNTVVACGAFEPEIIDIFNHYGVAVLERGSAFLDHPGVIGTLVGDEPKPENMADMKREYEALRAKTDKPLLTCMVGDSIGVGGDGDALNLWRRLQPQARCFRWYGIKKSFYGVMSHPIYKGVLPFTSVLRIAAAADDTPYWVVLPAYGGTEHEAYFQYPAPAQMKAMMHLALAYGARGLLLYSYQGQARLPGMVDPVTLQSRGEVFAAAGEVAEKIERQADLIRSLRLGGLDVRCPSPYVEAVPLLAGEGNPDGKNYVYAVNKNTQAPVSTRLLLWADTWELNTVRDVFGAEDQEVKPRDEEGYLSVPLTLPPGEGRLLATDAKARK